MCCLRLWLRESPTRGLLHGRDNAQAVLNLSVVTILDIEMGILSLEHRNDHVQARRLRAWMGHIRQSFARRGSFPLT